MGQAPSPKETILRALQEKKSSGEQSLVGNIPFRNIGPTIMGGRVVDLDVNPDNPIEFYVGYASGGLWYTNNNGTSFTPVMDSAPTQNVGDIAVHWKSGTLWVGTGENNASRSSYAGIGLLKSIDKGKNWDLMGLEDSHHIGRILINPENPDEVVVGARRSPCTTSVFSQRHSTSCWAPMEGVFTKRTSVRYRNWRGKVPLAN